MWDYGNYEIVCTFWRKQFVYSFHFVWFVILIFELNSSYKSEKSCLFICLFLCLRVLILDGAFSYSLQEGYYCFLRPTTKNFLRHFLPKRDSVSYFTLDIFYVRNISCCKKLSRNIFFLDVIYKAFLK